jgi:hypothetical protein
LHAGNVEGLVEQLVTPNSIWTLVRIIVQLHRTDDAERMWFDQDEIQVPLRQLPEEREEFSGFFWVPLRVR